MCEVEQAGKGGEQPAQLCNAVPEKLSPEPKIHEVQHYSGCMN